MSKCGLCGEDFGSGSHQILECRAKRVVPKNLYDRMCVWMANEENPEDFYESFETGVAPDVELPSMEDIKLQAEVYQKEEAFDIMYELHNIYNGTEHK